MRKFLVFSIVGFLVLFGTTVHAQKVDFKASGFIFMASFLGENTPHAYDITTWQPFPAWMPPLYGASPLLDPSKAITGPGSGQALDKNRSFMQTRGILKVDASIGKEITGTVIFEMDSGEWGERGSGRNNLGSWNADQAAVEIKNIYIDVALPYFGIPVPITARVGVQGFALRPQLLGYFDGPGITGGIRIDPITIQPIWFKVLENQDFSSDDVDIYGLNVFGKFGTITAGAYGIYQNANTYPLPNSGVSPTLTNTSNMWWFGIYSDGRFGPVDINFDLGMDTGKVEDKANRPTRQDVKYQGWAGRLKVDFPWEKFNFGVIGMYGSGSNAKKTDGGVSFPTGNGINNGGLPGGTTPFGTPNRRVSGYVQVIGSEQFPFGDSLLISGDPIWNGFMGYSAMNYSQMARGAIGGTWIAKLYGSVKATPWYKVTLSGIYIGDTTKNANTWGSARKSPGLSTIPRDDKTIGFELDLINQINIYNNLRWDIGLGYIFAGDALDYFSFAKGKNISADNPWALVTRLTYTF